MSTPPRRRVLLVDDDAMVRRATAAMVQYVGGQCDLVESGEAAIAATAATFYDLVLMDLQMPGIDGLEATRRILATARDGERWRIVGLSGDSSDVVRYACRAAGMEELVEKPLRISHLQRLLGDGAS